MTIFYIVLIMLLLGLFFRWFWWGLFAIAAFELVRFLFHIFSGAMTTGLLIIIGLLVANFFPLLFGGRTLVDRFNI